MIIHFFWLILAWFSHKDFISTLPTVTPKTLSMFASNTVCKVWHNQGWESYFTLVVLNMVSTPGYKSVPGSCDLVQWLWRYGQFEMQIQLKGFFTFELNRVFGCYQYLVWPPFALSTAWILLGMLPINFWHSSAGIFSHSTWLLSCNSWIPLGGCSYSASLLLR